ncbi:Arachidonate 12-lipoxygenase, 12R-type [Bulinus truncatus]|nr:Arachidonate 12-lipoxygenase, 12R-type [Bulinus truncatus]
MFSYFGLRECDYIVEIKTGDSLGAGTNANVWIILYDENSNATPSIKLDQFLKNNFERGSTDVFQISKSDTSNLKKDGQVAKIDFWRDDHGNSSDWYVDEIEVKNKNTRRTFLFPVNRWVSANKHYKIKHLDTSLPQHEDDDLKEIRKQFIEEKRKNYVLDQKFPKEFPNGPVQVKSLPVDEKFSFNDKFSIVAQGVELKIASKIINFTHGNWTSIEEISNIFVPPAFPRPETSSMWMDDVNFGRLRIAGINNSLIELVKTLPQKFPVTDDLVKQFLGGLTLQEAINQKRLFICDLQVLEGLPVKQNRKMCVPIALFFVDMSGRLRPVAIQLFQKPGPNNPIFTPRSPSLTWTLVKMWYNNADSAYHQALTHLGFTHLLMESFSLATQRNLSHSHPVFKILAPHFLNIMAINSRAVSELIADGGWVDKTMNYGNKGMYALVIKNIGAQTAELQIASKIINLTHGKWKSIADISTIFAPPAFPKPETSSMWMDDVNFGRQRIAGINNSLIELVKTLTQNFPVTDDLVKPFLGGLTLQEAINQKRLFICDLQVLEGLTVKQNRKMCVPIALFFVDMSGRLRPVAIQLFQKPGPNNPIFTPGSPSLTWTLVKMWYNNSDSAYHQALTHLGFTHLLMESFSLATQRNLSHSHPVFKILAPHFLYIMAINSLAVSELVSDGGWVDRTMNYGNKGMYALVVKKYTDWRLDVDGTLPEDLKRRGLDDPNVLPNYHYRDDAILIYNAISKYVQDYLALYYTSTELVARDHELQSWAQELVKEKNFAEGGFGIKGLPGNGILSTVEQIQQIVTSIIFICSVGHAAANFGQYDEYGFPPNYPLTLLGEPPVDPKAVITEQDILKALPDKETTLDTLTISKVLSTKGTRSLGDFEVQYIVDPKAKVVVDSFRKEISEISQIIKARNKERLPKFKYLDPEFIPNSISI